MTTAGGPTAAVRAVEDDGAARARATSTTGTAFRVLVVCTGNICRSPAVERLLAVGLDAPDDVVVTSAGTRAVVGRPVHAPMVPHVVGAGAAVEGFAARQITAALVREADLVVTMTREHRSAVVQLAPAVVRRTFTLRELARVADALGPARLPDGPVRERLAALVRAATAARGALPVADPADDDVVDPFGRPDAVYAQSFAQLRPAVDAVVRTVRGRL